MEEKIGFGAYIVIPTCLLTDEKVSSQAILTFGIISNLSNQRGYCFASNAYIASLLNLHENTISKHIAELTDAGYLIRFDEVTPQGLQRRLALSDPIKDQVGQRKDEGGSTETGRGGHKKRLGGVNANVDHNNIRLIPKENNIYKPQNKIVVFGEHSDKYLTIWSERLNDPVYRINGVNGLDEYFQANFSHNPRPEFASKFLMSNNGSQFNNFKHLYNSYNKFIENHFK